MCGIAGFFSPRSTDTRDHLVKLGRSMGDAIAHRGPDGEGVWVHPDLGIVLSHRRLAIVDLSPHGHQPMVSASGRYIAAFNGEIYNFPELRRTLEAEGAAPAWRGHSDTEVLLAACELWGIKGAIQRANGMFALAVVDLERQTLVLARDRMGEKPLYYGWQGNSFLFGSELRALRSHPDFVGERDSEAVSLYFRFGYVPTPWSIYRGIRKLEPAHLVEIDCTPGRVSIGAPSCYWRLPLPVADSRRSEADAIQELDVLLRDSVRMRMHSDVPLGAFLSGGIDSSTIVAMMQAQSSQAIRTFSIGFEERDHDESHHARVVARTLGTAHTELRLTPADALRVVPMLRELYDEPFADSSQIPTYVLAKLTRAHVTVALSGDAGDELFGGYHRYVQARRLLSFYKAVSHSGRRILANGLRALPARHADRLLKLAPKKAAVLLGNDRLHKLAEAIDGQGAQDLYKRLVSQWAKPVELCRGLPERDTVIDDKQLLASIESPVEWMMHMDQRTYLPDDILVKVDRATMAVALEGRVPFLDHRLVEFAATLPFDFKLRGSEGKWLLRQVLYKYVDRRHFDRPKQGFGIPLAAWLRGPLRDWAEDLLSEAALIRTEAVDVGIARAAWSDHVSGKRNLQYPLWTLLMFQAWCRS